MFSVVVIRVLCLFVFRIFVCSFVSCFFSVFLLVFHLFCMCVQCCVHVCFLYDFFHFGTDKNRINRILLGKLILLTNEIPKIVNKNAIYW